ncbi:MAG TPA: carboxypeptidase regulatory-like domain-containing protein [Nitrospiria bacterium]
MVRFLSMVMLSAAVISSAAAQTGGVAGRVLINSEPADAAVVYLTATDGRPLAAAPVEKTIRQENIRFKPEFVIVPAGSVIRFENHDDEIHTIYSKAAENRFDTGAHLPHTVKTAALKNPGAVPIRCRTHSTMRGMIYVTPSPYFSVTDELGRFKIEAVPPGRYRVAAWHPRLTSEEQARGAIDLKLDPGVRTVLLQLQGKAPPGTDLTETPDQGWTSVVEQIREELSNAIALWKNGGTTPAAVKVMSAQSRLYGETGLRKAIAQSAGRSRADEHERRMDALRKQIQGISGGNATESTLSQAAQEIIQELTRDVKQIGR